MFGSGCGECEPSGEEPKSVSCPLRGWKHICVSVCLCELQPIVASCSSLPRCNIRPCRHLGPVAWALGGASRLGTGPDYFLHSPELNPVYVINQLHAVWAQLNHAINPVRKGLFTKIHTQMLTLHKTLQFNQQSSKATLTCRPKVSTGSLSWALW